MGSPWEYREIMKAVMRYGETRTVEEVVADQKNREAEREMQRKTTATKRKATPNAPLAPKMADVPKDQMEILRQMMANAPARPAPVQELVSAPDE